MSLKKSSKAAEKREFVDYTKEEHGLSMRSACDAIRISRSVYYYEPDVSKDDVVIAEVQAVVERYPAYGFSKVFTKVRRAGHPWNHKRVYRVYCALNLNLRRKGKKRLPSRNPEPSIRSSRSCVGAHCGLARLSGKNQNG